MFTSVSTAAPAELAGPAAPPKPHARSIRERAIRGSAWTVAGHVTGQVLRLGSNLTLAWLLVPEMFGLMVLVNVFIKGLEMFSDIGIGPSIIQSRRGDDPAFLNTAWTIQVIRGFVLWVCACLLAWPAAWFYARNDPLGWELLMLLPVAAVTTVIYGFKSTNLDSLNRHLALGRFTFVQVASQIVGISTMIAWALVHRSVWALVAGGIAGVLARTLLSHLAVPGRRNHFTWNSECARALIGFGKWIFLSTAITFLAMQADKLLLGSLIPLHQLGIYSFGLMLALLPTDIVLQLAALVLFPALAERNRTRSDGLQAIVRAARGAILRVASFMVLGVVLLAPLFFELLYPAAYHDAGWIAQLVSLAVWLSLLSMTADRALLAIGTPRPLAVGNAINLCVTVTLALAGFHVLGLPGFILGYACGRFAGLIVIELAMWRAGMPIHRQDAAFTLALLAMAAVGIAAGAWLDGVVGGGARGAAAQAAVAAIILAGFGAWSLHSILMVLRR